MKNNQDYRLYYNFIETFSPNGFNEIDVDHLLMLKLEKMTEINNQFFFLADLLQGKILYCSKRSLNTVGIESTALSPYHMIEATHPDDVHRITKGWAKLLYIANDLLIAKSGSSLFSTNMKLRNPEGEYSETLFQCYLFYSEIPQKKVYLLQIHTNIDWCKKINQGFYYYSGNNLSHFKYPDDDLLNISKDFTKREFEIIKLIETGMSSEQIANKLFVSTYTVNTHRANILKKSGKAHVSELIYDLMEQGVL
jgi:hypothetical protein